MGKAKRMAKMLERKARKLRRLNGESHPQADASGYEFPDFDFSHESMSDAERFELAVDNLMNDSMSISSVVESVAIKSGLNLKEAIALNRHYCNGAFLAMATIGSGNLSNAIPKESMNLVRAVCDHVIQDGMLEICPPLEDIAFEYDRSLWIILPTISYKSGNPSSRNIGMSPHIEWIKGAKNLRSLLLSKHKPLIDVVFELYDFLADCCRHKGLQVPKMDTTEIEFCLHGSLVFSWAVDLWRNELKSMIDSILGSRTIQSMD